MLKIERYEAGAKARWDALVAGARNATFLFQRDYMDYHADRFADASLAVADEGRWIAVLPANRDGDTLVSHGGLTFGGFVFGRDMRAKAMIEAFDALLEHARAQGLRRIVYKAVPHIYHAVPAEEDLYALARSGARLFRRDVSSTVAMDDRYPLAKGRKACVSKARRGGLEVRESREFERFMAIEVEHLGRKYGRAPVHSAAEISLLASRFPQNIRLFAAYRAGEMLGGCIVYESTRVAHAQYIAATESGKDAGALDLVMEHLLSNVYAAKRYFDFGISTEEQGRILNEALIANKESFGARATCYDAYELAVPA